jgi:hypothetical protein
LVLPARRVIPRSEHVVRKELAVTENDQDRGEPETLSGSEALDEDELRVDPLEGGVDPTERWSAADRFGTTPSEIREGEPLSVRLAEEEPDVTREEPPERPVSVTPAEELDETVDSRLEGVDSVVPDEFVPPRRADPDPPEHADEAGGSMAETLRTPPQRPL